MHFLEPLGRDLLADAVGLHPLGERSAAAQRVVELAVRLAVAVGVALDDVDVEVGLAPPRRTRRPRPRTCGPRRPAPADGRRGSRRAAGSRPVGACGTSASSRSAWRARSAGSGAGSDATARAQRGIAGEGVDVALLDPVESQTEQQIFADQGAVASMPTNANCKTEPMPRTSEPSPYVEFDRSQWRALRMSTPLKLTEDELVKAARPRRADRPARGRRGLPAAGPVDPPAGRGPAAAVRRRPRSSSASPSRTRTVRCRSSSASRAASRSASPPPPVCCRHCWRAGSTIRASTSSPPTASCTRTPNSSAET